MKKEEEKIRDELMQFLMRHGINSYSEVVPTECKTWSNPYRVDLVIPHPDLGLCGVECKHINTSGSGGIFGQAFVQIKKYQKYHYFDGVSIKHWFIAPFVEGMDYYDRASRDRIQLFIRHFFQKLGVGFLNYNHKYQTLRIIPIDGDSIYLWDQ